MIVDKHQPKKRVLDTSHVGKRRWWVWFVRMMWVGVHSIWAVPVIIYLRIQAQQRQIRLCLLNSSRIGHFVVDGAHHVYQNETAASGRSVLYYWNGTPCNSQVARMLKRALKVQWWVYPLVAWDRAIPGRTKLEIPSSPTGSRDLTGAFAKAPGVLSFTMKENQQALAWLQSYGWQPGEDFVCLLVRDGAYLHTVGRALGSRQDWSYHDYRNSEIDDFVPAVKWLTDQGIWVLRMGSVAAHRTPFSSPRFIDYPFESGKCDLLDIWLFANCSACISTASGPDSIAAVFNRPTLFVNALPINLAHTFSDATWYPKHLSWEKTGVRLSLVEHLDHSYLRTEDYDAVGISISSMSPEEIRSATEEFWWSRFAERMRPSIDSSLSVEHLGLYLSHANCQRKHGWVHPNFRLYLPDHDLSV